MKRRPQKPIERDLFGAPLRPPPPDRRTVAWPDGSGYTIAVRQPGTAIYHYRRCFCFASRREAEQALRAGVGLEPCEDRTEVRVEVFFSRSRGYR